MTHRLSSDNGHAAQQIRIVPRFQARGRRQIELVDIGVVVGLLEAIDDGSAAKCDPAAIFRHGGIGLQSLHLHRQHDIDSVARSPMTADLGIPFSIFG